jgi:rfaE bifunctional protein nucleotidyltransferase chain/domain
MCPFLLKIMTLDEALQKRQQLFRSGLKLVFTNGCFDLLHPGHLAYLSEARSLGDFLLVGLNSDSSIRRLKGPARPVLDENQRAQMLAALEMVDAVTVFQQDTPLELIETLKPDFLVKGGDWAVQDIVGGPQTLARGGEVRSLTLADGFSTTNLINKILRAHGC